MKIIDYKPSIEQNYKELYYCMDREKPVFEKEELIILSEKYRTINFFNKKLVSITVNTGIIFDSTCREDINKLYKAGFKLKDPFVLDVPDGFDEITDTYQTADSYLNSIYIDDTWACFECTKGVCEWILNNGYDSIMILDDQVKNYITKAKNIECINLNI